jgi:Uma2 family endonuclease
VIGLVGNFLENHDIGRLISNNSGVVTERGPDSVRGPDVSFYSYAKLPKGPVPAGYPSVPPDIVFEVLSPDDRWPKALAKAGEYLDAGVGAVCVLDPARADVQVFTADEPVRVLTADDELTLLAFIPGLRVAVRRFFE